MTLDRWINGSWRFEKKRRKHVNIFKGSRSLKYSSERSFETTGTIFPETVTSQKTRILSFQLPSRLIDGQFSVYAVLLFELVVVLIGYLLHLVNSDGL